MLSKLTPERIKWLVSHPGFRKSPIRVALNVAAWEWTKFLNHEITLPLTSMRLKVRPFDGAGRLLRYFGEEGDDLLSFLRSAIKPGMTVVDVGANIGSVSVPCSRLVGEQGKIIAIEGDEGTADLLRKNLLLNNCANVDVRSVCVGEEHGHVDFYVNSDSSKSSIIRHATCTSPIRTEITTLDALLADQERLDVLKIDVEGADYKVLLGATGSIETHKPSIIIVETNADGDNICRFLVDRGYRLREYDRTTGSLRQFKTLPANLFAVRDVEG